MPETGEFPLLSLKGLRLGLAALVVLALPAALLSPGRSRSESRPSDVAFTGNYWLLQFGRQQLLKDCQSSVGLATFDCRMANLTAEEPSKNSFQFAVSLSGNETISAEFVAQFSVGVVRVPLTAGWLTACQARVARRQFRGSRDSTAPLLTLDDIVSSATYSPLSSLTRS